MLAHGLHTNRKILDTNSVKMRVQHSTRFSHGTKTRTVCSVSAGAVMSYGVPCLQVQSCRMVFRVCRCSHVVWCSVSAGAVMSYGVPYLQVQSYRMVFHVCRCSHVVWCSMSAGAVISYGVPCLQVQSCRMVFRVCRCSHVVWCSVSAGAVMSYVVPCLQVQSCRMGSTLSGHGRPVDVVKELEGHIEKLKEKREGVIKNPCAFKNSHFR